MSRFQLFRGVKPGHFVTFFWLWDEVPHKKQGKVLSNYTLIIQHGELIHNKKGWRKEIRQNSIGWQKLFGVKKNPMEIQGSNSKTKNGREQTRAEEPLSSASFDVFDILVH